MSCRILHVTDFHIRDPSDSAELLRKKFYDEYLAPLRDSFKVVGAEATADLLVATGDFVDCGLGENFEHAGEVLKYLGGQFEVRDDRIITCIGNHDIDRELESKGEIANARKNYWQFANAFLAGDSEHLDGPAVAGLAGDDLAYLSLDATRMGIDKPGKLEPEEADNIVDWVKSLGNGESDPILVVCSHFPVDEWAAAHGMFEDPGGDWHQRHIWSEAAYLKYRIHQRWPGRVIWLAGDIHREADMQDANMVCCSTGRLGVTIRKSYGDIRRQATLLEIDERGEVRGWRSEYRVDGGSAQKGEWIARAISFAELRRPAERPRPSTWIDRPVRLIEDEEETEELETGIVLVDEMYEAELLRQVAEDGLYRFGRFETNREGWVSLGWVNVEGLCALNSQLEGIVRRMAGWIRQRIVWGEKINQGDLALIGLDCWGAILGSQLAVKLGARFVPVASRAEGLFAAVGEHVDEEMIGQLGSARGVILVTDVVGSGTSLLWCINRIREKVGGPEEGKIKWFSLCLICDENQERKGLLEELEALGTLCSHLKMPLVSSDTLPSEDVLPAQISFHQGDLGRNESDK